MKMSNKVFELLPQTDCRRCGRNSCFVFATEIAQKQCCIEACPDVTDQSEKAFRRMIAAEQEIVSWLGGLISGIRKSDVTTTLAVCKELFFLFPVRIVSLFVLTFPLTYPFIMAAFVLYNR